MVFKDKKIEPREVLQAPILLPRLQRAEKETYDLLLKRPFKFD